MNDYLDIKIEIIKAIESIGIKYGTYKMIFKKKGKYGTPEAWLYQKNGNTPHGYLIEKETIQDKEYLKEYLRDFIK